MFNYLTSVDSESIDIKSIRIQFGLEREQDAERSPNTLEIKLDVKDEFIDSQNQGL